MLRNLAAPVQPLMAQLHKEMRTVIRGKDDVIHQFLIAFAAGGSVLLEDVPGVGKTTLAKAFARLVDVKFERIQCTPDLLPSDVCGFSVFNSAVGSFEFRPGPVFCNLLLVDEINRASPRTQSALLEAMAERQVTTEGECHELESPFLVIATQNPLGYQGTYPLPEAQLDRFLFCLRMEFPAHEDEIDLLYDQDRRSLENLKPLFGREKLSQMQEAVKAVEMHRDLADYIVRIVAATRNPDFSIAGCSPRGTQMLFRAAQACAFAQGRSAVLPDDIKEVAPLTLAHRVVLQRGSRDKHGDKCQLIEELVNKLPVPA